MTLTRDSLNLYPLFAQIKLITRVSLALPVSFFNKYINKQNREGIVMVGWGWGCRNRIKELELELVCESECHLC